jgi:hypothetical protein
VQDFCRLHCRSYAFFGAAAERGVSPTARSGLMPHGAPSTTDAARCAECLATRLAEPAHAVNSGRTFHQLTGISRPLFAALWMFTYHLPAAKFRGFSGQRRGTSSGLLVACLAPQVRESGGRSSFRDPRQAVGGPEFCRQFRKGSSRRSSDMERSDAPQARTTSWQYSRCQLDLVRSFRSASARTRWDWPLVVVARKT